MKGTDSLWGLGVQ